MNKKNIIIIVVVLLLLAATVFFVKGKDYGFDAQTVPAPSEQTGEITPENSLDVDAIENEVNSIDLSADLDGLEADLADLDDIDGAFVEALQ